MAKTLEQAISERRHALGNQYAYLPEIEEIAELKASRRKLEDPYAHADECERFRCQVSYFDGLPVETFTGSEPLRRKHRSDTDVQRFVRDMQRQVWEKRAELFQDHASMTPVEMLDPIAALELLGYKVDVVGALGTIAGTGRKPSNVAGLIDNTSRQVLLASGLSPAVRRFTAAHELGHALMHEFVGMHRDKPLDGSSTGGDPQEREADRFAVYFLMPERLLRSTFEKTFGKAPLTLNDETRFALSGSLPSERWQPKTLRDLSRLISSAERFNGFSIVSLMSQFGVSRETMAIRLEELALVSLHST